MVSALLVGATLGALTAGQAADALGPGRALLWNNVSLLIGSALSLFTPAGYWGLLAGEQSSCLDAVCCLYRMLTPSACKV